MDQDTRHWYLQQMGIPVWLPKDAANAAVSDTKEQKVSQPSTAAKATVDVEKASPAKPVVADAVDKAPEAAAKTAVTIWLVMPNVQASEQAAAKELLNKILAAVAVSPENCELIWGLPDAMPSAAVKWVWCFGVQPPPGLAAKTLSLPSFADMLANVEAKKHAWGQLKSAMPFA